MIVIIVMPWLSNVLEYFRMSSQGLNTPRSILILILEDLDLRRLSHLSLFYLSWFFDYMYLHVHSSHLVINICHNNVKFCVRPFITTWNRFSMSIKWNYETWDLQLDSHFSNTLVQSILQYPWLLTLQWKMLFLEEACDTSQNQI